MTALARHIPRTVVQAAKWAAVSAIATVNVLLIVDMLSTLPAEYDWRVLTDVGHQMLAGDNPYDGAGGGTRYRYSPLFAPVYAFTAPLGVWFWRGVVFASLLLLPRRVALLAVVSFPFWFDIHHGNILTVMAVMGFLSVQGKPWAQICYLLLTLLVPRPIMLPVALWIIWQRRAWWPWLLTGLAAYAIAVWATGWGGAWLETLSSIGGRHMDDAIGWSRLLGPWWPVAAAPLTAFFLWRRSLGLASLSISPYWITYYAMFLIIELAPRPSAWLNAAFRSRTQHIEAGPDAAVSKTNDGSDTPGLSSRGR